MLTSFLIVVAAGAMHPVDPDTPLYETETLYQHLEIRQEDGQRTLYLGGSAQNSVWAVNRSPVMTYERGFELPLLIAEESVAIQDVLFIGGGGFNGPRHYRDAHGARVDVAELDPGVVRAAKRYLGVRESDDLRIHVQDGRRYLQETDKRYDLILVDAYRQHTIPAHLVTQEFMQLAQERLTPDGMLLLHVISAQNGPDSQLYAAEYRTLSSVFPTVYGFALRGGTTTQSTILVGTQTPRVEKTDLYDRSETERTAYDLTKYIDTYDPAVDHSEALLLTDEYAPVDSLIEPAVWRRTP